MGDLKILFRRLFMKSNFSWLENLRESLQFPVNKILLLTKTNIIDILCRM